MLLPVDSMDRENMLGGIDRDAFEFHSGGLSWQFHRPNVGTFDAVGPSTPTDGIRDPVPNSCAASRATGLCGFSGSSVRPIVISLRSFTPASTRARAGLGEHLPRA